MGYRHDLWEIAAAHHGVVTVADAEDAGVPAVEVRKLASRGALQAYGHGVYTHRDVPTTRFTQPAAAVALAGNGAFLYGDAVFSLLELGQFNPRAIRVGTRRRVRRTLPDWMSLEPRPDVAADDLTQLDGIAATTVARALHDVRPQISRDRWAALVDDAVRLELVDPRERAALVVGASPETARVRTGRPLSTRSQDALLQYFRVHNLGGLDSKLRQRTAERIRSLRVSERPAGLRVIRLPGAGWAQRGVEPRRPCCRGRR